MITAGDGVPLLANRFYPADIEQAPLVLLRSPYGRGVAWTGCRNCWLNAATRCCM